MEMKDPAGRTKLESLRRKASLPRYVAMGAVGFGVLGVLAIVVSLMFRPARDDFRMSEFPTQLSSDVVAVVDGYERSETDGEKRIYSVTADRAVTYSDGHQELERVALDLFDGEGNSERISAPKAVYIPEAEKKFSAYFTGGVTISGRDGFELKTSEITYKRADDIARTEEALEFKRGQISGSAEKGWVEVGAKRIGLDGKVRIGGLVADSSSGRSEPRRFEGSTTSAVYDASHGTIDFPTGGKILLAAVNNGPGSLTFSAPKISGSTVDSKLNSIQSSGGVTISQAMGMDLKWFTATSHSTDSVVAPESEVHRLAGDVRIQSGTGDQQPTTVSAQNVEVDRPKDTFTLRGDAKIGTTSGDRRVDMAGNLAAYERMNGKFRINGNASVTTDAERIEGADISGTISRGNKISKALASGSVVLIKKDEGKVVTIRAEKVQAEFDENQNLKSASSSGRPSASLSPVDASSSDLNLEAKTAIRTIFREGGSISRIETEGRTSVSSFLRSGTGARRTVTADRVNSIFSDDGRTLISSEAVGNAQVEIIPQAVSSSEYRTIIASEKFTCRFFTATNDPELCFSDTTTRTTRLPYSEGRQPQIMTSDKSAIRFDRTMRTIERIESAGNVRLTEADRVATGGNLGFSSSSGMAILSGRPAVSDSQGRFKADEIRVDTVNQKSLLSGSVSATLLNKTDLTRTTPFNREGGTIYATSNSAEVSSPGKSVTFLGNARIWQGNDFIRGEKIEIFPDLRRLNASGRVQTLVIKSSGSLPSDSAPIFGTGDRFEYDDSRRVVRYEGTASLRRGTDRIEGNSIIGSISSEGNLETAEAYDGVRVAQPGRTASGNSALYVVRDERIVLKGTPAKIEDSVNGSASGEELNIFLRERRVTSGSGGDSKNNGRVRSVYKTEKPR